MSRLTGADALGLYEAYQAVYAPQELTEEQVWEEVETWVNSLIEEGYDLSDYTWEEMYEAYLEEQGGNSQMRQRIQASAAAARATAQRTSLGVEKGADGRFTTFGTSDKPIGGTRPQIGTGRGSSGDYQKRDAFDRNKAAREQQAKTLADRLNKEQGLNKPKPTPNPVTPVTPTTPKPSATTAAKPAAPAAKQTGDKTKDMATFAKANPKLAAAAAEKARIRGTSQSDNPLMKGMPGKRPMTPSVQSPTLAKDLGKGSGNQSLLDNPNASKAAPPKAAPTTAPKPTATPARNGFGVSAAPIAAKASVATTTATPTPAAAKPATPKPSLQDTIKKNRGITSSFDLFDLVKGHLLDEGYAESEDAAMVIMVNMSEEWRESILESYGVELVMELTGGKGHPGYKAGSRDLGPMQSGHPADSRKRQVDGGTMSQRHGYHLGDIDDDDDDEDEDEYESIVKQQSRDKREILRKPLRKKVKSARKAMTKEEMELDESQYARENPEKYERDERKSQSNRERRMNDPNTGINSPAFQAFMAQQMGGKKKKKD